VKGFYGTKYRTAPRTRHARQDRHFYDEYAPQRAETLLPIFVYFRFGKV